MDNGDLVRIEQVVDEKDARLQSRIGFISDIDINDVGCTVYTVMLWERDVKASEVTLMLKAHRVTS